MTVLTSSICWPQRGCKHSPLYMYELLIIPREETNIFLTFYKKTAQRKQVIAKYNCQHHTLRN